jgi:hypothetical protein
MAQQTSAPRVAPADAIDNAASAPPVGPAEGMNNAASVPPVPPADAIDNAASAPPVAPADAVDDTAAAPPVAPAPTANFANPYSAPYGYGNAQYSTSAQPPYGYGNAQYSSTSQAPYYYGNAEYPTTPLAPYYTGRAPWPNYNPAPYAVRPRVAYAPSGLVIPVMLATSISTQVARVGDYVQANLSQNVPLRGLSYIPAGSALVGEVTTAEGGRLFNRSGALAIKFDQLRLPDGRSIGIQAHVLGNIAHYEQKDGEYRGEGWGAKLGGFALRAAIGAGGGAVLGTAIGAIASHGAGIGTGAWAGTAIGGGIGAIDDLIARRGRNVLIHAGTPMQVQLDQPIMIPQEQGQPAVATGQM